MSSGRLRRLLWESTRQWVQQPRTRITDSPEEPLTLSAGTGAAIAGTLKVPGARLYYEVRGSGPVIALLGSPMDARSFEPLAEVLAADHTVLTTDPRGVNRSLLDSPDDDSTPELRADDLSRLLTHLGVDRAAAFGSSGGAVTVLALAQAHPEQVHTVIAHEPPLELLLDDAERRRAAVEHMIATYRSDGPGAAWAAFMAEANMDMPEEGGPSGPIPEPAERDPQEVADERHFFLHELRGTALWEPDISALRDSGTRIVVGIGEDSTGEICDQTSRALAARLGIEPMMFPGGHIVFVEDPGASAAALRELLPAG